ENLLLAYHKNLKKPKFKRFNDLRKEDINFDFHMHTNFTDGHSRPEEMVKKAEELKLSAIAFSEHVTKESEWFDNFSSKINSLKNNNNIRIFLGIEAKINDFNGEIDATDEMINKADIVVGVVHRYPDGKKGLIPLERIKDMGMENTAETEFKLAMKILDNKDVDVLGHPFGVYSNFFEKFPEEYMKKILEKAVKKSKAVEINTKYLFDKEKFFSLLREINPLVSIGSDAHHKSEIARDFSIIKEELEK
ncbi:MAG: PHP domain-containing protein, partial [Candidatus Nanoarchaeia archaeon]|nr:PHP domain-containing protein [Candidatus Nanoarchaeia archaeon]